MTHTRGRATLVLFAVAGLLSLAAVVLIAATPGEGANIGAGGLILLAMLVALGATVGTLQQEAARTRSGATALGRRTLTWIAVAAAAVVVLAAAVGQWPLAIAAAIPAVVCAFYGLRDRTS